tara:strand:- start:516 stop:857 length:342 start_codon:yes stop_codon:yes gene_type:complete
MKRSCPFDLPQQVHPQLRICIPEHSQVKRKGNFEQPVAKRFCTHECLKRKIDAEDEIVKRRRLEEAESRTNMLVEAYRQIDHLEQIIRQLGIELEYYRNKTSNSQYINGVLAY